MKTEPTEPAKSDRIVGLAACLGLVGVLGIFVPIDPWASAAPRLMGLWVNGSLAALLHFTPRRWVLCLVIARTLVSVGAQVYRALHARANLGGWVLWAVALLLNILIVIGCSSLVRARARSHT